MILTCELQQMAISLFKNQRKITRNSYVWTLDAVGRSGEE